MNTVIIIILAWLWICALFVAIVLLITTENKHHVLMALPYFILGPFYFPIIHAITSSKWYTKKYYR